MQSYPSIGPEPLHIASRRLKEVKVLGVEEES